VKLSFVDLTVGTEKLQEANEAAIMLDDFQFRQSVLHPIGKIIVIHRIPTSAYHLLHQICIPLTYLRRAIMFQGWTYMVLTMTMR
jgi:hypothetical protein